MTPLKKRQIAGKNNYYTRGKKKVYKTKRVGEYNRKQREQNRELVDENNNLSYFVEKMDENVPSIDLESIPKTTSKSN
jgi:hypothetical protein